MYDLCRPCHLDRLAVATRPFPVFPFPLSSPLRRLSSSFTPTEHWPSMSLKLLSKHEPRKAKVRVRLRNGGVVGWGPHGGLECCGDSRKRPQHLACLASVPRSVADLPLIPKLPGPSQSGLIMFLPRTQLRRVSLSIIRHQLLAHGLPGCWAAS